MIRRQPESELRTDLRAAVDRICADFPGQYWRDLDRERAYPEKFVAALTGTGCLGALIPEEYGGLGLSLGDASVILEQINANGANAAPVHAQLYTMGSILRHGSPEQKATYLPVICACRPSPSPSRPPVPTRRTSPPPRCVTATATW
jgi:acyl-CoA dehydrogenase